MHSWSMVLLEEKKNRYLISLYVSTFTFQIWLFFNPIIESNRVYFDSYRENRSYFKSLVIKID